jgi:hypothetical protein
MVFVCKICESCPKSHSLFKFEETIDRIIYYTRPSDAKDNNIEGILYHYDGVLGDTKDKNWVWVLDLKGYGIKQMLEIQNTIQIVNLIKEKYSKNLQKIIVINTNSYTGKIYKIIKPFLNKRMQSMLFFSQENLEKTNASSDCLQMQI